MFLGELDGKSEICDFDASVLSDEDVIALEIPMDLFVFMKSLESLQYFLHDIGRDPFWDLLDVLVDDLGEAATVHVLDEHEQTIHVVVGSLVVYDILVGAHRHHGRLDLYLVQDVLFRNLHHPHRPAVVLVLPVEGLVHRAHGPLAQLLGKSVVLVGIVGQEVNPLNMFVELAVSEKVAVRGFILLLF